MERRDALMGLDAIYVINVRAYEARRQHVKRELDRFSLEGEFIFEMDASDLTPEVEASWFLPDADMSPGQKSCALKHMIVLEKVVERRQERALVLEDDVVLDEAFPEGVQAALEEGGRWPEPKVIFLGSGGNFYTPRSQRVPGQRLYPARRGRFTDSYIIGHETAARRLAWIREHRMRKPVDNEFDRIDTALGITMLWLEDPVVEQGSKNGLFTSELEHKPPSPPVQRLKFALEKLRRKYLYQLWR
jgi:glycosyl transferase family 25